MSPAGPRWPRPIRAPGPRRDPVGWREWWVRSASVEWRASPRSPPAAVGGSAVRPRWCSSRYNPIDTRLNKVILDLMSKPVKKRAYSSPVRQEQAALTRARILEAAGDLFVSRGYARTTIRQIADAANVSVDTVYVVF